MSYIYLASPYSHADLAVMQRRYEQACRAAAILMERGLSIFAPIAHSHPIAGWMDHAARTDFDLWMRQDLPILRHATELWVLCLPGWDVSRGVKRELEYAAAVGIPVKHIEPNYVYGHSVMEAA